MADQTTTTEPITQDEYVAALGILTNWAKTVQLFDLARLRDFVSKAETLAPLLEPTAYQRGGADNLRDQRKFLNACATFQAAIRDITEVA